MQVDVVVVDKSGQPIRGLKATDFQLFDRQQPQAVVAFDEVSSVVSRPPSAPALASIKKDVADNRSAQSQRLIILVVDDLHIYRGRTDKAKELAREIVNTIGADASMALLFTSGEHSTQVTEDRAELLAAVETLKARQTVRRPHEASDTQTAPNLDPEMSSDAKLAALVDRRVRSRTFSTTWRSTRRCEDAARLIGSDSVRRKAFVMLSEGIDKDLTGMFDTPETPCDLLLAPQTSGGPQRGRPVITTTRFAT